MNSFSSYKKITMEQIAEYADPYAIKNFILSANINSPVSFSLREPFIVDGILFSLCLKGSGKIKINYTEYEMEPSMVLVLLPNQIANIIEKSDDLLMETLYVSWDFILEFPFPKDIQLLINVGEWPCMKVSQESMQDLIEYYAMIVKQYNQVEQPYRIEIVKGLLYTLIMELFGIYIYKNGPERKITSRQEELASNFFRMLLTNFRKERSVAFYADKLCVTSKHLSTTVKKVTGKSILDWIHEAILIDAKMLLRTSSMTVLQISETLNFPSPSFFGKFFKEHTGITPLEFREEK